MLPEGQVEDIGLSAHLKCRRCSSTENEADKGAQPDDTGLPGCSDSHLRYTEYMVRFGGLRHWG